MRVYYTYLWLREDGTPYYVGKGSGNRAFIKAGHRMLPPPKERILLQEFPDSQSAFDAEMFLISYYGRKDRGIGCLRNLTDGGDRPPSASGLKRSAETRAKMSASKKGIVFSAEHRAKISASHKGKVTSAEHRAKISARLKGKILSAEHRAKISASHKGKVMSAEHRAKLSTVVSQYWADGKGQRDHLGRFCLLPRQAN